MLLAMLIKFCSVHCLYYYVYLSDEIELFNVNH
uniref:Uncharacterized protein n=1 Tax=Setaria viridis TaxID=4556 RepID=A0A4U6UKD9_SETVI|nr:hypothetical protein SEVIR_5G245233v2 [Setaria viridis]